MKKLFALLTTVVSLFLLMGCGPSAPTSQPQQDETKTVKI
jgi:predicted small lipoprotein YifL